MPIVDHENGKVNSIPSILLYGALPSRYTWKKPMRELLKKMYKQVASFIVSR